MEDPVQIVMLESSSNKESEESSFFTGFKNTFCRMHALWTEIDKRFMGALYGELEKFLGPRSKELSEGFNSLAPQVAEIVKLYEKTIADDDKLKQMVKDTKRRLEEESKKAKEAQELNDTLQKAINGPNNRDHHNPHVSIEFSTIFDLGIKGEGWKVNQGNPDKVKELMQKKIMTVGVLGAYDAGKTYLCNILGNKKLRSGHNQRTAGIEVVYPEEDDVFYGLIDVPGSQEAHPINDMKLVAKLPSLSNQTEGEEVKKNAEDDDESNNTYLERYNLMHNDARLTHSLKEKFIVENVDMVVIVTNKLSESDQEMIYKNLNYFKQWRERKKKKGVTNQKYLYVVHNFKMLTSKEDVEKQIEKDIKMCFEVEKTPIFSTGKTEGCNSDMYIDQFGVCHLVLAKENTEAGNYYNTTTIEFLKSRIKNTECKSTLNLVDSFQKFCNTHLEKMIGQKIELAFDEKASAFINKEGTDIKIDGIIWTSLGEVVTSDFKPKYSILDRKLDNGDQELVVEVESIDCERVKDTKPNKSYMTAKIDSKDGYNCLKLKGTKVIDKGISDAKDPKNKPELINYSRGEGNFDININLVKNKKLKSKEVQDLNNGITRFTFRFSEEGIDDDF